MAQPSIEIIYNFPVHNWANTLHAESQQSSGSPFALVWLLWAATLYFLTGCIYFRTCSTIRSHRRCDRPQPLARNIFPPSCFSIYILVWLSQKMRQLWKLPNIVVAVQQFIHRCQHYTLKIVFNKKTFVSINAKLHGHAQSPYEYSEYFVLTTPSGYASWEN